MLCLTMCVPLCTSDTFKYFFSVRLYVVVFDTGEVFGGSGGRGGGR